jgi:hypothetical protein
MRAVNRLAAERPVRPGGRGRQKKSGPTEEVGSTLPTEYEDVQKSEKFRFLRITIS